MWVLGIIIKRVDNRKRRGEMRKGFTLIELLIVVIILGILATIALPQFGTVVEKAKRAEADSNIAALETGEAIYYVEEDEYTNVIGNLDVSITNCHWTTVISNADSNDYTIQATRRKGSYSGQTYEKNKNGTVTGTYSFKP